MSEFDFQPAKHNKTKIGAFGQSLPIKALKELAGNDEWLEARRVGLGGSDAAPIMGLDDWKGPYAIWLTKKKGLTDQAGEAAEWGHLLENPIAEHYANVNSGFPLRCTHILGHPEYPWMLANVDRVVVNGKDEVSKGLEIKTAGRKWWDGPYPEKWNIQIHHYMAVTGMDKWDLAVLVGGQQYEQHTIKRDDALIDQIIAAELEFWERYIIGEQEPPPDTTDTMGRLLGSMQAAGEIEVGDQVVKAARQLEEVKKQMKGIFAEKSRLEGIIKHALGDKVFAVHNGEHVAKWPSHEVKRVDTKKLKREYPEIVDDVMNVKTERRLTILVD